MSRAYRLNVRFDLNDEEERKAAEYLTELNAAKGISRNRFIVEAVISFMKRQNGDRNFILEDIRQVFREELSEITLAAPVHSNCWTAETELTEEQKAENSENVLSDLSTFF